MDRDRLNHEVEVLLNEYRYCDPNYITRLDRMRAQITDKIIGLVEKYVQSNIVYRVKDVLPKIDEYVLWIHENGSMFEEAIDKDWDNEYLKYFLEGYGRKEVCGPILFWMRKPKIEE